jgi:acyl dehydratase
MTTIVDTIEDLTPLLGQSLGSSSWIEVDQHRVDTFADATDDHQWIHTDPERAKDGPFGGTIAHGYLTLALLIPLWTEILDVRQVSTKVNYGLDKVRFPAPVPVGSKVRMSAKVAALDDIDGGAQMTLELTFEREGGEKPVCVAQSLVRLYA